MLTSIEYDESYYFFIYRHLQPHKEMFRNHNNKDRLSFSFILDSRFFFSCEDAAQQVLMSSVCVSVPQFEILSVCIPLE